MSIELLSIQDSAAYVVEEMLEKYGKHRREAARFCLVQVRTVQGDTSAY